jgi:L-amino acid N-acyltransferase YncA
MIKTANASFVDYPYFSDGQFALEGIQPQLAEQYLTSEKGATDFYSQTANAFADLRLLSWDSDFFQKRLSRLVHFYFSDKEEGQTLWKACENWLRLNAVEHVTFRINEEASEVIGLLKEQGFEQINAKHLSRIDLEKQETYKSEPTLEFSQASITDTDSLLALAKGNFKENRFFADDFFDNDKAGAMYEAWIANKLKSEPEKVFKGSNGAKVIGFSILSTLRPVPGKQFGVVELIAVDPAEAGQGYGKRITRLALQQLSKLGTTVVFANVVNTNVSSLKMFHGVGFATYATLLEFRKLM